MPGAVFLLNSPYSAAEVWDHLPKTTQQEMLRKKIEFYVIDGYEVAREAGWVAHQHHHADLLLCHQRRVASRRSH